MGTALEIPWVEKSWAVNRLATCDAPVFWLTMDVPTADFSLYVGACIPRLECRCVLTRLRRTARRRACRDWWWDRACTP